MREEIQITLPPEQAAEQSCVRLAAATAAGLELQQLTSCRLLKRSIDARSRDVKVLLKLEITHDEPAPPTIEYAKEYPDVHNSQAAIIVGAGPAGLFAALKLIEHHIRPIVIERGKDVRARRRDIALLSREGVVNPESNYCFGEGGAGTYSDGKLYTRSDKRGNIRRILETLVAHGATEDILIEAHPHIGTNHLPQIITSIRETIIRHGGEVRFETLLTDLVVKDTRITGAIVHSNANGQPSERIDAENVILATGHSARDIFELLHRKAILIEAKPFALGVRVEHPQELIDRIQYRTSPRNPYLPAASYALVEQIRGKGVYSFCMCPGGIIAPCATRPGEIVTNGWSPSKRNNPFANSGIVVSVEISDMEAFAKHGPLRGIRFQQQVEQAAWHVAGSNSQTAPAQRLVDFTTNTLSSDLPTCSYQPGLASVMLRDVLPKQISIRLSEAFRDFGKKMRGYYTNEAVLVAPESRTSSPVRIPRDLQTLEHPQITGLYPCGEGAGYAGGIVSAAMDGERVAEKIGEKMQLSHHSLKSNPPFKSSHA